MQYFLERLVDKITEENPSGLSRLCIVFPNRRAGLHFKNHLAAKSGKAIFPPSIFAIQDLIHNVSSANIPENLTLVFELFRIYQRYEPSLTFDKFYLWGEMILADFDTLDKNLVNTPLLFKNIKNLKEIEQEMDFSLADIESFKAFWETFSYTPITEFRSKFLHIWEVLGRVYIEFKEALKEKNYAYEGMLYRELVEDENLTARFSKWDKIIFAGFNILSGSEHKLIFNLMEKGIAETFWDTDKYYVNDDKQEAGKFLRKNFKKLKLDKVSWIENNLLTDTKNISTYAVPLNTGQVKALSNELVKLCAAPGFVPEKTAIVLPDEKLLIPLLYSLPAEIKDINVTMGFALKDTPFYSLLELIKEMQANKQTRGGKTIYFHHKDITRILLHPYLKFLGGKDIYNIVQTVCNSGKIYLAPDDIYHENSHPVVKNLFSKVETHEQIFNYILNLIEGIRSAINEKSEGINPDFETEHFYQFHKAINRLKDIFDDYGETVEINTFWVLLTGVLKHVKIPFTGEPLKGLQIMGVLETRALDFENVFILSMNEGIFPKAEPGNSFIPYNLRKAFGLPVFEDEDSGYAYNFYRLLQRAKNVHMFYNNEAGNFSTGERSRFIAQLEFELIKANKNITYKEYTVTTDTGLKALKPVAVSKSPDVMKKLGELKYLSPSGLAVYIQCPLQFYLQYIAGLKEPEKVEEIVDPMRFGNILHAVMCRLYTPFKDKVVTYENINSLYNELDPMIEEAFRAEVKDPDFKFSGKNLLLKKVIHRLVCKILDNDKKDTPFTVKGIEESLNAQVTIKHSKLNLYGKLDRIDIKDNITRIIDYKTGTVNIKKKLKQSDEEYLKKMFTEPDYSQNFQAYFYAYLYSKNHSTEKIMPGLYPLKKMKDGIRLVAESPFTKDELAEFEKNLIVLLEEIYNPDIPFYQKEDAGCMACDFKTIGE